MPYVSSSPNDAFYQLIMQYSPEAAFAPGGQQISDPAATEWLLNQMAAQQGNPWGGEGATGSNFSITGYGVADRPLQPSDLPTYVPPPTGTTGVPNNAQGGNEEASFTSTVYAPKPIEPIPSELPNSLNLPLPADIVLPEPELDPKWNGPIGPIYDTGFKIPIQVEERLPPPKRPAEPPMPEPKPPKPPTKSTGGSGDPPPPPPEPPTGTDKPKNPLGQIAAAALPFLAQEGKGGGLAVPMTAPVVGTNTMQNSLFPMQQQGVPIPGNLFSFIKGGMIR